MATLVPQRQHSFISPATVQAKQGKQNSPQQPARGDAPSERALSPRHPSGPPALTDAPVGETVHQPRLPHRLGAGGYGHRLGLQGHHGRDGHRREAGCERRGQQSGGLVLAEAPRPSPRCAKQSCWHRAGARSVWRRREPLPGAALTSVHRRRRGRKWGQPAGALQQICFSPNECRAPPCPARRLRAQNRNR